MAQDEKWVTFDDEEEALSLSDLPMVIAIAGKDDGCNKSKSIDAGDEFEFRISGGIHSCAAGAADMCAADEVFFRGRFLPLRPSVSSGNSLFAASGGASRYGSMWEPMEWHSAAVVGGFNTSRSNSSSASSACVSRSHSSNSHSSSGGGVACDPPRRSLSNNFYSHPSPSPRVRMVRNVGAGRRSTSSLPVGWGIFRLGVAKVPEIELYDLRSWRSKSVGGATARKSDVDVGCAIRRRTGIVKADIKPGKYSAKSSAACESYESCGVEEATAGQKKKAAPRAARRVVSGFGFSCKCSPDDVVPSPSSKAMISRKQKDREGEFVKGRKRGQEQQDV